MSETVEYEYRSKALVVWFFALLSGGGLLAYIYAVLHNLNHLSNGMTLTDAVVAGVVFVICALNILSDKMLCVTETELQIPQGWILKKSVTIAFYEIENLNLIKGDKSRILLLDWRNKKIFLSENLLPNENAFDEVSKISGVRLMG
jgi:hypothetical protein